MWPEPDNQTDYAADGCFDLATGDFNSDGNLDIVAINNRVFLLISNIFVP